MREDVDVVTLPNENDMITALLVFGIVMRREGTWFAFHGGFRVIFLCPRRLISHQRHVGSFSSVHTSIFVATDSHLFVKK